MLTLKRGADGTPGKTRTIPPYPAGGAAVARRRLCAGALLDGRAELDSEPPDAFAREMARVHAELGTRLLGGCWGTDERPIATLAGVLTG
ncbi:Homocysteine S-methyltransferase [Archangium gephyra]|uniref:Homocysteine S-methyltransferase n=1 Tax=Archangium gephyra TaxID=48 RepID=A0AAC8QJE7_9BACT|nr:Homocysteine S-methyltransferase [Archangium gephyra]